MNLRSNNMGNNNSKWSDFTKEQQIEAVKDYAKSIQKACDELLARIEAGDIEEISQPEYMVSRKFSSGDNENPEFSFHVNLSVDGLAKKEANGDKFWPSKETQEDTSEQNPEGVNDTATIEQID